MSKYSTVSSMMPRLSKICARIDVSKATILGDLKLDQEVKVKLTGKVTTLRGPEEGKRNKYDPKTDKVVGQEKYLHPGSIEIELEKIQIEGVGEFDGLEDD